MPACPCSASFTPPVEGNGPLVLLSAGVGITPMVSVLTALPEGSTRPVLFAHAARHPAHHALAREVAKAAASRPGVRSLIWYEDMAGVEQRAAHAGRMSLSLDVVAPYRDADFYLCGPLEFMRE